MVFSLLAACATTRHVDLAGKPPPSQIERELAGRGPQFFTVEAGTREGEYGCRFEYELYRPAEPRTDALVVLGHGFASNLAAMRGWAERWASFGVPTAVLSFCNSTPFAGRHDRNAEDMVALAHALHGGPVIYAGFSAGGLSAYLAAASDPRAIAYLGLDAVDSGGMGARAEAGLKVPALFLMGEPSSCNAENNMLPAIPEGQGVTALRVRDALHCYFQDPWQRACESVCGKVAPPEAAARIADTIRCLATAWLLEATGARPGAGALVEAATAGEGDWAKRVQSPR
jgi:pimeloyl-ACP methyl ester carboxylesterase